MKPTSCNQEIISGHGKDPQGPARYHHHPKNMSLRKLRTFSLSLSADKLGIQRYTSMENKVNT